MKLSEFVEKYMGVKVDYDKMYGAQCVDLARQYIKEVLEVPQPEGVIGAENFYTMHENRPIQKQHFNRIEYIGGMRAPAGSLVVFGSSPTNKFGHIGICVNSDDERMILFEQDGFKQEGAKIHQWNYERVLGWLVKKESA